jgi:hypothetical protein
VFEPRRLLRNVQWPDVDRSLESRAEWWLLSAVKDPLAGAAVPYVEQVFPSETASTPNPIAYGRDYLNPWAVHALVMGPYRVRSPRLLHDLALRWLESVPSDSADAGAALCLLAYRALDETPADGGTGLLASIGAYREAAPRNPQVARWQVSLTFVEGLWRMRRGEFRAAEVCLAACAGMDATAFTPHLETKTTEAAWLAGRLALERGDRQAAAAHWMRAFEALDRLRATSSRDWLVSPDRPAAFEFGDGLREIAVAVDNAALAANALRAMRDPAPEWRPGARQVERNFQQNHRRLLQVVDRRGGEIAALRNHRDWFVNELAASVRYADGLRQETQELGQRVQSLYWSRQGWEEAWKALAGNNRELAAQTAQLSAENAVLKSALRGSMERVVIVGGGEAGRRVWEAVVRHGRADVVGFVDADARARARPVVGQVVHPPEWLATGRFDSVALGGALQPEVEEILTHLGLPADRIVRFTREQDDEAFARLAAERYPDPLRAALAQAGSIAAFRVGVFGTGTGAMRVWQALTDLDDTSVSWFADNNPEQHGRTFLWLNVISPASIPSHPYDAIVVGSMARDAIRGQLMSMGIPEVAILTPNVTATVEELRGELRDMLRTISGVKA